MTEKYHAIMLEKYITGMCLTDHGNLRSGINDFRYEDALNHLTMCIRLSIPAAQ